MEIDEYIKICKSIVKDKEGKGIKESFMKDFETFGVKDLDSFIKGMAYASYVFEGHKYKVKTDPDYRDFPILETMIGFIANE